MNNMSVNDAMPAEHFLFIAKRKRSRFASKTKTLQATFCVAAIVSHIHQECAATMNYLNPAAWQVC
jgi:hypothetical protein